jgi:hypothetical protein
MDLRCSHLANDLILLDENVPNNKKPETGLFQAHTGVKIVNRDNIPRRPSLRIRSECRGNDPRIPLTLSDPQMVGNVVGGDKNEGNGDNRDKKVFR